MPQLAKLDANNLAENLRAKIQTDLVALIPEEQWIALLQREVDHFITVGRHNQTCGLRTIVERELTKIAQSRVQAAVEDNAKEWGLENDGKTLAGEFVTKIVTEHGATIFAEVLSTMVQATVNNMQQQTRY